PQAPGRPVGPLVERGQRQPVRLGGPRGRDGEVVEALDVTRLVLDRAVLAAVGGIPGLGHRVVSSWARWRASVWRALWRWALAVPSAQSRAAAISAMLRSSR